MVFEPDTTKLPGITKPTFHGDSFQRESGSIYQMLGYLQAQQLLISVRRNPCRRFESTGERTLAGLPHSG